MADDRYDKPRIADDFPAINRRMRELKLGGSGFALPQGVAIFIASDIKPPVKIPLDKDLTLMFHPATHRELKAKLIVFHFDQQETAVRKLQALVEMLLSHYPSTKRISSEIHLSMEDGLDLLGWLR